MGLRARFRELAIEVVGFIGIIARRIRRANVASVIVMHEVKELHYDMFNEVLAMIDTDMAIVSPEEFEGAMRVVGGSDKDMVMLTFDDGFQSWVDVSRRVLEPMDIKALFFVDTGMIGRNGEDAVLYIEEKLERAGLSSEMSPITKEDIRYLRMAGHTIGSHGISHTRLSELTREEIVRELELSKQILEDIVGDKVEHYAYPFGTLESLSEVGIREAGRVYKYCYTGLRGSAHEGRIQGRQATIPRQAISLGEPMRNIRRMIKGDLNWLYCLKRYRVNMWTRS